MLKSYTDNASGNQPHQDALRFGRVFPAHSFDLHSPLQPAPVAGNPADVIFVDGEVRRLSAFGTRADDVVDLGDEDGEVDGLEDVEHQPAERALDAVSGASGAYEVLPCYFCFWPAGPGVTFAGRVAAGGRSDSSLIWRGVSAGSIPFFSLPSVVYRRSTLTLGAHSRVNRAGLLSLHLSETPAHPCKHVRYRQRSYMPYIFSRAQWAVRFPSPQHTKSDVVPSQIEEGGRTGQFPKVFQTAYCWTTGRGVWG